MLLLIAFAFLAGLVTILSPCILPILPIVLSGSFTGGHRRPLGVITGFVISFTVFTLLLTSLVRATNIPPDSLRLVAVVVVFLFGLSLLVPYTQVLLEKFMSSLSRFVPRASKDAGFGGGVLIGLSLGLVWTPCVGPILASIITLASTSTVTLATVAITLAYSLGTALPMLGITYTGRSLFNRIPWLLSNSAKIQKAFGIVMMVTAVGLFFNVDRQFQTYILEKFPQYGVGLTSIENNQAVQEQIDNLQSAAGEKSSFLDSVTDSFGQLTSYGTAPEITGGGRWINSEPLTLAQLRAEKKVALIDFWTYSCINCIRTLPYLKAWHDKYADDGLVIIGVHSPEFAFEHDYDNVVEAVTDFGIKYPVVQDNDFAIWRAYDNHYWPAKYLVDAEGTVRLVHFGEGAYDETEAAIQKLLREVTELPEVEMVTLPEFSNQTRTPETYLGYERLQYIATPTQVVEDAVGNYTFPESLELNSFGLSGQWLIAPEFCQPQANGRLQIRFVAKQVNLVMAPAGNSETIQVLLDGQPISAADAGSDVTNAQVTVDKERLFSLVELEQPGDHVLELVFPDGTTQAFAFTFG